ncbi:hypothetical protein NDU88_000239 [Pleurodeles waltl]|uniref:B30.2/SPRY domain-containing protein n=1 Tax=Pleurodeles waltl TaxID=8319 RepID=A0AAV7P3K6_PLEWA|nr:hypothetical protein NDU88_000239 [Pleurodeles waltl]
MPLPRSLYHTCLYHADAFAIHVLVTLDPDTVSVWLVLLEDKRRVRFPGPKQSYPESPKRFEKNAVLGSNEFSSGKHYWEVQLVTEGIGWSVGVARQSVTRQHGSFEQLPEDGIWSVHRWEDRYQALGSSKTLLSPHERPRILGVYLDYEGSQLSVYNADTMELLYTFTHVPFNGSVYPYFYLFGADMRLVYRLRPPSHPSLDAAGLENGVSPCFRS